MALGIIGLIAWIVSGAVLTAVVAKAIELPWWVVAILMVGEGGGLIALAWFVADEGEPPDSEKVAAVRRSRRMAPTIRGAGRVGAMDVSWPGLAVSVHEAGIVIAPSFGRTFAILRSEITGLRSEREILTQYVEIHHTSSEVESPLALEATTVGDAVAKILEKR
ncbi:MAG TPA: hypothetical protein VNI54_10535 [Thermoanaerobaculia bacterium]|nr:hypothetical protein [Thermoanaerobaculia bacterium]